MSAIILTVHLLIALALIGTILLQRSEGGALGIGGGGGGGANVFSSRGSANALTRATAILAVCFFATSITLALLARGGGGGSVADDIAPAADTLNPGLAVPAELAPPLELAPPAAGDSSVPEAPVALPEAPAAEPGLPEPPVSQ